MCLVETAHRREWHCGRCNHVRSTRRVDIRLKYGARSWTREWEWLCGKCLPAEFEGYDRAFCNWADEAARSEKALPPHASPREAA